MKPKLLISGAVLALFCATAQAQIPMVESAPTQTPVPGYYDPYFLPTALAIKTSTSFGDDADSYVAHDRVSKGQTFTTGSSAFGYTINSITIRHILFSSGNGGTYGNFPNGSSLRFRFGSISGNTLTPMLTTNAVYSGPGLTDGGDSGTGDYFTFNLSGAGIGTLSPNTTYFFELAPTANPEYFEMFNQINPTSYANGTSFKGDDIALLDADLKVNLTAGEFTFDANLNAVGAPVVVATTDHPYGAVPGDSVTFTATITPGNGTLTNVNLDLSVIGGSSMNNLVLSNANVYTNTFAIPAGAPIGTTNLAVIALQNAAPLVGGAYFPFTVYTPVQPTIFGVYRELWNNLNSSVGNTLAALTNTSYNPNWPTNPAAAYTQYFTGFETPASTGMNYYGQRLRAFVVPPTNGNYTFWIASDDSSEMFISTDEAPANETAVASVSTWTGLRVFSKETNQQSPPIYLQGGQRYYLEALMQQGNGGDNLTVQWQLPNGTIELPLASGSSAGTLLVPFTGLTNMPGIYFQPATNTVGLENSTVTFSLLVTNPAPVSYQWQLSGTNLPGASSSTLLLSNLNLSWSGQAFSCVVSNLSGSVTSTPSLLTVLADTNPPTILNAVNLGHTNVQITYSKVVEAASATNTANYVFTNGLAVTGAALNADNQTVILTTAPLNYGSNYWIVINHVRDRASLPNTIAMNTLVTFPALPYAPLDLGNPVVSSTVTVVGNGFNVTAAGSDFGGSSDQGNFSYQLVTGNFDFAVRVAGLSLADIFAKAGLMARENLTAGSRFAAAMTTPAMNGSFFEWRDPAGNAASTSGNFPANYPNMWLRLRRAGNTFTGFASYDGQVWTQLGSDTISMPSQIYLGFSVSSRSASAVATAQFRDIANLTNAVVGVVVNPHEAMGPSSRKSPVAFSEIMWKPAPRTDGKNLEFVEIYNSNPWFQDISGYHLTCADMNYTFPPNTQIPGGGYLVVAAAPTDIQSVYGITNVMGPYNGSLKKTETLGLLDEQGAVLLTVPYSDVYPWPVATDGTGHSLVLAYPTYGEGDPRAWDISDTVGGSPGRMDAFTPSPLRNVVINEFLAHTDPPDYDYIELYNHSASSVDISGCILTDDATTNKFVIPPGTIIPPRGFVFYSETNMNFALNALGESIFFIKPDGNRILDAVQFATQQNGVAMGRWPDGANDFYRLQAKTPGTPNAPILISDVVINELMYNPISGNDDDQYVELYNRSTNTINLGGWQLAGGVTITFPANVRIPTNGYIVVARNLTNLFAKYPNLNTVNAVGNFSGKLSHSGEYLALTMPAEHKTTDGNGNLVTNIINIAVNDLTYGTGGRWGEWSSGGGSSLELIDPNSNNRLAANWADSDDTAKSVWTNIECTGVLDNGGNYDSWIDYAQIGLLDVGECLVDNIEVDYNGTNYVANGTFESGTNGWTFQGDMVRSSLESTGYVSGHSLHIRCSDRIWTGDNSCEMALNTNSLASGQTATLRFKARWLHGWPEALMRLNGNWLEAAGPLPVPNNLGTPGMPNSQYIINAGPAIYTVTHNPPVPAANQSIVVTAQVHDPDGVTNLTLRYRLDPATTYSSVPMKDDGTGGDAIAGDGIFSATIPGQAANQIVAFYISATDSNSAASRFPAIRAGDNEPVRECVVMFGDGNPRGSFSVYHLWITQTNATRWANLSDLSNEGND
jgi:regulation of enolase protein 1 (concanavalin A-like superfamily)